MIFETLNESADKGELLLVEGGLCHYHFRRDKQITVREILVLPTFRGRGIGRTLIQSLVTRHTDAALIVAVCPADLPANEFYAHLGFICTKESESKRGRKLREWTKTLPSKPTAPSVKASADVPYCLSDMDNHWTEGA